MTKIGDSLKATEVELVSGDQPTEVQEVIDQECADFQDLMAERIGRGEDLTVYPHMQTCDRCTALLRELETIAAVARELMPFEVDEPRDELWTQIQMAIERGDA